MLVLPPARPASCEAYVLRITETDVNPMFIIAVLHIDIAVCRAPFIINAGGMTVSQVKLGKHQP